MNEMKRIVRRHARGCAMLHYKQESILLSRVETGLEIECDDG